MKTTVIIVAAGMGRRMASKTTKQLLHIGGKPILYHTILGFQKIQEIDEIILVIKEDEATFIKEEIVKPHQLHKVKQFVIGGAQRSESVYRGLVADQNSDIILIHDGVRPFVQQEDILRLIERTKVVGASILAVPVKDTIKNVENKMVQHTYDRSQLWQVQTPQCFKADLIKEAFTHRHRMEGPIYDDSMMVEQLLNHPVEIVEGRYTNIKITTQSDLMIGEAIYHFYENQI